MSYLINPKEKAQKHYNLLFDIIDNIQCSGSFNCPCDKDTKTQVAKSVSISSIKNEYHTAREIIFNLRSSRVIENEIIYLSIIDNLNDTEKKLLLEINNL